MHDAHLGESGLDLFADVAQGHVELQGAEGYVVADGGREELNVGVLEDEANAAVEAVRGFEVAFDVLRRLRQTP